MKNVKGILCLIMALIMAFSLCATAFADDNTAPAEEATVEEVVDEVAQKEAEAEAEKAAAEAEAEKVNDVVDLDAAEEPAEVAEEAVAEEAVAEEAPAEEAAEGGRRLSGPILCLIVAVILIIFGLGVIALSNNKIKKSKKGKAAK